ncbi:MAG: hypothetical protein QOH21_2187 [Acidobacteriota bacterium]|jgi:hypothetical protein|nr:hypothetical protein [Acidobacteriota bacterium]
MRSRTLVLFITLLWFAVTALAQTQSGNIFGTVTAPDGGILPGVTVTLSGVGAPQTAVTDSQGHFRFISLSPGTYELNADELNAELADYGVATRRGVAVNIGRNTEVGMTLNPTLEKTITVTAAPLIDARRIGTGGTVDKIELEQVPTARDPWVILQQIGGVLMDRNNIGGSESGQQSSIVSKGANGDQTTFSVDGVNTTDMVATGGSADYFDFGSFEEIQVTTGGTDPRVQTPGAQLNIVTKRGTNDFNGSARYYLTPGGTQGRRKIPEEALAPVRYIGKTNEIDEVTEWGFEAGGPVIHDRLWLWAAYADNDINLFTAQPPAATVRFSDRTQLETLNAKLNAQLTRANSATLFYYDNSKVKAGRNASPQFPPETTWNQSDFGPAGTYKIEDTHIFSANLYLTGLYSKVNGGFQLQPNSGANCTTFDCVTQNATKATRVEIGSGTAHNTYLSVQGVRPQEQTRLDGSTFFSTGSVNHELKFGFGYRSAGADGLSVWPQNQLIYDFGDGPDGLRLTYFFSAAPYKYEYEYQDVYVGDTLLAGNLTVQGGLRFDRQHASASDQVSPANAVVAEYLPQVTYPGNEIPTLNWDSISPRIGLTYALGQNKKTLVRAAYNRYVGQLGANATGYSPGGMVPGYKYIGFYSIDADHNDLISREEVLFDYGVVGFTGFDPSDPTSTINTRRIADDLKPQSTDELILGIEREVLTDLVVSANVTHRLFDNFLFNRAEKTRGAGDWYTSDDYEVATILPPPAGVTEGGDYAVPVYQLKAGVALPTFSVLSNRDGYTQTYDGLELGAVKRMSHRWMMRGNISIGDWRQQVDASAIVDPTALRGNNGCATCDDAQVVQGTGVQSGPKGGVWINSNWSMNASAVYQLPLLEANLGANFNIRQGYPVLYVHPFNPGNGEGTKNVLVNDIGDTRLPNPYSLDLRLAKDFRFRGIGLELGIDAFNVTNEQTILQRNATLITRGAANSTRGRISELQNPRVLRFGARFVF